jgi:hypothetical protein
MYVGLIGAFPVFLFLILYCVVGIEKDTNAMRKSLEEINKALETLTPSSGTRGRQNDHD